MKNEAQRLNEFMREAPELIRENKPLIDFLTNEGFFKAPASTKYHGNYPGGLYDHSFRVYEQLAWLSGKMDIMWTRPESPFIVGMFHDLCKIDQYNEIDDDIQKSCYLALPDMEAHEFYHEIVERALLYKK